MIAITLKLIILLLFLDFVLFLVGFLMYYFGKRDKTSTNKKITDCKQKTLGKITDLKYYQISHAKGHSDIIWKPTVKYQVNDIIYEQEAIEDVLIDKYYIEEEVIVNYNFENPKEFYISDLKFDFKFSNLFSKIGILFMSISLICIMLIIGYFAFPQMAWIINGIRFFWLLVFNGIPSIIGITLVIAGIVAIVNTPKLTNKERNSTSGIITDTIIKSGYRYGGSHIYHYHTKVLIVEYKIDEKKYIRTCGDDTYQIGDSITVYYNQKNPKDSCFKQESGYGIVIMALLLIIIGSLLFLTNLNELLPLISEVL